MQIDRRSFEAVARAVRALNPAARQLWATPEDLADFMDFTARAQLRSGAGYCATDGFMLTAYRDANTGEVYVIASNSHTMRERVEALAAAAAAAAQPQVEGAANGG